MKTKEIIIKENKQQKIVKAHITVKTLSSKKLQRSIVNAIKDNERAKQILNLESNKNTLVKV